MKEKGIGQQGMEVVDSMAKVEEMLAIYESEKILNITVLKKSATWPSGLNIAEELVTERCDDVMFVVDKHGVSHISDDEALIPVAVDYSDMLYVGTQQSCNQFKAKTSQFVPVDVDVLSDDDEQWFDDGQYRPEDHNRMVQEELELVKKLKRKKMEKAPTVEEVEILERLAMHKKQKEDPFLHYEGDTDVEELFTPEEDSESDCEEFIEPDYFENQKIVKRAGPTSRSHYEPQDDYMPDFVPSSDEANSCDDLADSDDDGAELAHVLPSGLRSKLKKQKKRVWYDASRADPGEQFCVQLCFKDIWEFRTALRNYHIAQLRDFKFHRNEPSRIIAKCTDEGRKKGCPFYITASVIAHEKTFCIRKFLPRHLCQPLGENTKVTIEWLTAQSMQAVITDPKTNVDTLIENVNQSFGVKVPRSKAYRARKKAFDTVIGDQRAQYTRIRDYLQAILDTNPGSKCIVTTKELIEHPNPNPRFHGLFVCLNASKEGFLNGCRPFIGTYLFC